MASHSQFRRVLRAFDVAHDTLYSIRETIVRRKSFASEIVSNFDIFNLFTSLVSKSLRSLQNTPQQATAGRDQLFDDFRTLTHYRTCVRFTLKIFYAHQLTAPNRLVVNRSFQLFHFLCNAVKSSKRIINPRNA